MSLILPCPVLSRLLLTGRNSGKFPRDFSMDPSLPVLQFQSPQIAPYVGGGIVPPWRTSAGPSRARQLHPRAAEQCGLLQCIPFIPLPNKPPCSACPKSHPGATPVPLGTIPIALRASQFPLEHPNSLWSHPSSLWHPWACPCREGQRCWEVGA